jgi:DNA (cytosine-5)-methyltransferase 1
MAKLSVIDLFAGGGGFSEGFRQAGYDVKACLEQDQWAADTLRHNFKDAKVIQGDIRSFKTRAEIRAAVPGGRPDVIIGGPPCQGFSVAGPAKDPKDPRNSLFANFAEWVDALHPTVFVMENVHGLLNRKNEQGERVFDIIKAKFESLNPKYEISVWKLNSAHFGVPQIRHRIFIVGALGKAISQPQATFALPGEQGLGLHNLSPAVTVWEALSDLPELEAGEGSESQPYGKPAEPLTPYQQWARGKSQVVHNHASMLHRARIVERFQHIQSGGNLGNMDEKLRVRARGGNGDLSSAEYNSNYRHLRKDMISYTIPASFYSTFIHPVKARNLTAREAARLQSFPDSYCFQGKRTQVSSKLLARRGRQDEDFLSQYNQIGNAVPPLLAKAIANRITQHIEETEGAFCSIETDRPGLDPVAARVPSYQASTHKTATAKAYA